MSHSPRSPPDSCQVCSRLRFADLWKTPISHLLRCQFETEIALISVAFGIRSQPRSVHGEPRVAGYQIVFISNFGAAGAQMSNLPCVVGMLSISSQSCRHQPWPSCLHAPIILRLAGSRRSPSSFVHKSGPSTIFSLHSTHPAMPLLRANEDVA